MTNFQITLLVIAILAGAILGLANRKKPHKREEHKQFFPILRETRVRCPFYGFQVHPGIGMIDMGQGCNQCALKDGHSPCNYVYEDMGPQWPCKFVPATVIAEFDASEIRVYPRERRPRQVRRTDLP